MQISSHCILNNHNSKSQHNLHGLFWLGQCVRVASLLFVYFDNKVKLLGLNSRVQLHNTPLANQNLMPPTKGVKVT